MYIFFFAVLPCMAAFCFFMYYCRHHPIFAGGKLAENMYVSTSNKHGLSFSTTSYTSPSSNNCKSLNSPSTPSLTTTSTSSFKFSPTKNPGGSGGGGGVVGTGSGFVRKPPPTPVPSLETERLTATSYCSATNTLTHKSKIKPNTTINTNIAIKTVTPCASLASTPKVSRKLKPSSSNDNFHKPITNNTIQKNTTMLTLSKSHNEISMKTKIQVVNSTLKPPPPPPIVPKINLRKANSTCTAAPTLKTSLALSSSHKRTNSNSNTSSSSISNNSNNNIKSAQNKNQNSSSNSNSNGTNGNANTLRRKLEITDVRLNSTTNPHALLDGTTYTVTDQTNRCVYHL